MTPLLRSTMNKHAEARSQSRPQPSGDDVKNSEIARAVTFYTKNIRQHDRREVRGIYRQIRLMLGKGITLRMVSTAMQRTRRAVPRG